MLSVFFDTSPGFPCFFATATTENRIGSIEEVRYGHIRCRPSGGGRAVTVAGLTAGGLSVSLARSMGYFLGAR